MSSPLNGPQPLTGRSILAALKSSGVQYVLSVPDIVTSRGLLFPIANDPGFRLVRVCKEDECFGIASGLSFGDKRAVILIQHTGLLDSINALRAVGVENQQPICLMIGLLEKEPDKAPRDSERYGIRILQPLLDVMGVEHFVIETDADVAKVQPAIEACYARSRPVALLIGRRPS